MTEYFDSLETRDPQAREDALMMALSKHIEFAMRASPAMAELLDGHDGHRIASRKALSQLPVLRKSELLIHQKLRRKSTPFGGFCTVEPGPQMRRIFASPGPIYEPEGASANYWRTARALHAAGFRSGDLIHNSFSYHLTPAGSFMEHGAHALGCTVFPGGTGQTEQQAEAMAELQPNGYVGTPSFLRILLEKVDALALSVPSLRKALFSGEAFTPSQREWFGARGIAGYQCYGTADVGLIAYETSYREGLVVDEEILLEIVQPGTNEPVEEGEVGEVVVTTFNRDYPLIRFATGDLSAVLPGACPSGRTNTRIKGWLGRADQATKVRGMFVHPTQVQRLAARLSELLYLRLVIRNPSGNDEMILEAECDEAQRSSSLLLKTVETLRDITKLRGEVVLLDPGSLPRDGRTIVDVRSYE